VVGADDEEWGQRVVAFVAGPAGDATDDLDNYLKESDVLADYKRPQDYRVVSSIEQTGSGKKRRAKYRDLAEERT
jgi:acyl-CoA synthetase (AMP-forming)/AMP-acid ligase II